MRMLILMLVVLLACSGCTIVGVKLDASGAGIDFHAELGGLSTDMSIPLPDILPDGEPDKPTTE